MFNSVARASALLCVLLSACTTFSQIEEEHLLRCLPEEDALLYLEIDRGVYEGESGGAAEALIAAVAGRPLFPASGGLISLYLAEDEEAREESGIMKELVELARDLRVEDAGLFLDQEGRLCFYRLVRFGHLKRMLELLNEGLNQDILAEKKPEDSFEPSFPLLDAATAEAWQEAARANHAWLQIDGGALLLDVPMSGTNAARCLAWIAEEAGDGDRDFAASLFEQATRLEIANGHARLWFGEEPRPTIRFASRDEAHAYSHHVLAELKARDVELGPPSAPDRARAKIEQAP